MRSTLACSAVLLLAWVHAAARPVQTLTRCEDLSGWSGSVELSSDSREGSSSIAVSLPSGANGFASYDFANTGLHVSNRHSLSFWWKTEGNGLSDLRVRVRNHPLAGGTRVAYRVWSGSTPPQGWQLATVELAKPLGRSADRDQDLRYIQFRASTSEGSEALLFIDHVVAMDRTYSWRIRAPRQGDPATAFVGSGSDESRWYFPIEFDNHTTEPFWLSVGTEEQTLWSQVLQPGTSEVLVPIPADLLDGREDPDRILLWAQLPGFEHTRRQWTADLRQGGRSRTWEQFTSAKRTGTEPIPARFFLRGIPLLPGADSRRGTSGV